MTCPLPSVRWSPLPRRSPVKSAFLCALPSLRDELHFSAVPASLRDARWGRHSRASKPAFPASTPANQGKALPGRFPARSPNACCGIRLISETKGCDGSLKNRVAFIGGSILPIALRLLSCAPLAPCLRGNRGFLHFARSNENRGCAIRRRAPRHGIPDLPYPAPGGRAYSRTSPVKSVRFHMSPFAAIRHRLRRVASRQCRRSGWFPAEGVRSRPQAPASLDALLLPRVIPVPKAQGARKGLSPTISILGDHPVGDK